MDTIKLEKKLPSGAVNEIAARTGLSQSTVSNVLTGKRSSPNAAKVFRAAAEYLTEYKANEVEALQALQIALSDETHEQLTARLNAQREKYGEGTSPLY